MNYTIGLTFSNITLTEQEIIMAGLINLTEVQGFEQRDNNLTAYILPDDLKPELLNEWIKEQNFLVQLTKMEDQNWNAIWESNFEPVKVGNFCAIRANFHASFPDVAHEIIITPKMSFGTGHHATTAQIVNMMEKLNFSEKTVCDFGTGTGILAILAEKLGAKKITAIDNDAWSIENAKENILVNQCININLIKAEQIFDNEYDIILANINKNVLLEQMSLLEKSLATNGLLILSGVLKEDLQDMEQSIAFNGMQVLQVTEQNNWLCIRVEKNS